MKRKNGFTLIELLAVIVILAIIALIATPTILGVIEKAKMGAAKSSALGYIDAVEKYMLLHEMDSTKYPYNLEVGKIYYVIPDSEIEIATINKSILPVVYAEEVSQIGDIYLSDFIEVKGEVPSDGYVVIGEKNTISSATFIVNNYEVTCENSHKCGVVGKYDSNIIKAKSVTISSEKSEIKVGKTLQLTAIVFPENATNKEVTWTSSDETIATVDKNGLVTGVKVGNVTITSTTSNGKKTMISITIKELGPTMEAAQPTDTHKGIVYLDPTNLSKTCNASNSVSTTETKTGCMKWYIYDDSGDGYKLLLDHNTTARIKWKDSGSNVAYGSSNLYAVVQDLKTTSGWLLEPRLISADEINTITGKGFDSTRTSSWYYFDTKTQTEATFTETTRSSYDWLYNNLNLCKTDSTDYGCTLEDNNTYTGYGTADNGGTYGYWTSTTYGRAGSGTTVWFVSRSGYLGNYYANDTGRGVRPVITISKSIIS